MTEFMVKAKPLGELTARHKARLLIGMNVSKLNDCWKWKGTITNKGYGMFNYGQKNILAHRASYEFFVGRIPDGLTLNHKCRNRDCVNYLHLEPLTNKDNVLAGISIVAVNAKKEFCDHGHALIGANLRVRNNKRGSPYRQCKACDRRRSLKRYHATKGNKNG